MCSSDLESGTLADGETIVSVRFSKRAEHEGDLALMVNGVTVATTSLAMLPWRQTLYGMDIGRDLGSTVVADYSAPFAFTGALAFVDYAMEDDRDDLRAAAKIEGENALVDQ